MFKRMEYTYKGDLRDFQSSVTAPAFKYRIKRFCRNQDKHPLIVLGKSGSGKTLLAASIVGEMKKYGKSTYKMTCEFLIQTIVESIRSGVPLSQFVEKMSEYDFIIIDEIEDLKGKESTQHEVANIVCDLVKCNAKVILFGLPESEMYEVLKNTLATQNLEAHEVIIPNMTRLDRFLFIVKRCRRLELRLGRKLAWNISENPNMGAITGMLNNLAAYSKLDTGKNNRTSELFIESMKRGL